MADCSIAGTLEIIGDRWTILILRDAFRGVRRFDEIQQDLGIARNVLTDRLTKLVDHGVLEKRQYQDRPARRSGRSRRSVTTTTRVPSRSSSTSSAPPSSAARSATTCSASAPTS